MSLNKVDLWQDFARRMARTCYAKRNSPDLAWIDNRIQHFFDCYIDREDIDLYICWDQVLPYPESHSQYKKTGYNSPACICDLVAELFCDVWSHSSNFATEKQNRLLDYYWDRGDFENFDWIRAQVVERYEDPIHCCLRTGMDLIFDQSEGVIGFTAGDLQRMYPEGVPDWLDQKFEPRLTSISAAQYLLL